MQSKINNIITNFDGYDYYLYYYSGSSAWPKTNSTLPYTLYSSTSPTVLTWLGSANETSAYYGGILLSASIYDNLNQNNLFYTIPEYLREDPANDPYQLFVEMVGQHYDNIWIYYRDVTQKYNADNRLENGISKDIVADAIRDFGIKLYQNNFSNEDLYTAFLGLTPEGGLFPFPNITGSLPTPSGYEYIDTKISASNDYLPLDDVNKSLYKRIYHNLPYLLQTKGTLPGLRALITSYGIPDTILRIKEYGGKDKINTNDWDYWQNEFNYAYKQNGDNFISSSFVLNSLWGATSDNPETVMFRFKTNGLPTSSIPFSQSLFNTSPNTSAITLRYIGSAYISGSYSGSIIDPYYQYAYLDFHPNHISQPTLSASVYLPFFDGEWWSVMAKRSGTGASTNFELYSGNKMYESGENGTSISFFSSSSITTDDVGFIGATGAFFGSGSITVNLNIYDSFSGSFQEIRYYSKPIDESVFKDYVMNPSSIEGNSLNNGYNELAFRLSLGGELHTGSNSIHPKVTGSWVTTSSFASDSTASFYSTPPFVENTEYFYYDQPIAGIKNAIADKIRVENNVIPGGDVLSPFMSLSQQANISQSYTANTNLLEVAFSPQDEINDDINSSLGYFNIGEYIGDPRLRSSSAEFYPDLNALRDSYFEKYTKNYNLVDFVRLIKFFDNSLFKMIKDFVPARTSLASGIVIKQHILERNKYPQPQVDTNSTIAHYAKSGSIIWNEPIITKDLTISGTLLPQWNGYEPGTIENFNGGTAGTFEIFNGLSTSPSGTLGTGPNNIFNITQSWYETVPTPSGPISILHDAQDEFYDGEFSGSIIEVTIGDLNSPYPNEIIDFLYTPIRYSPFLYGLVSSPTGTVIWERGAFVENLFFNPLTVPNQGEILILSPFKVIKASKTTGLDPKFRDIPPYIKIHKIDHGGNNNDIVLGQATKLRIKHTTLPDYVTIGNIVSKTEYPTYWLYRVQSLGTNNGNNFIKDYSVSASRITPSFTLIPGDSQAISSLTELIDNLGYFDPDSGVITFQNTPNISINFSASLNLNSSGNANTSSLALIENGDITDEFAGTSVSSTRFILNSGANTVVVTGSFYPLAGDNFYLRLFNDGNPYDPSSTTFNSIQLQFTQSIAPTASVSCSVIIEPYITEPNFYNSDDNALLNSVNEQRESTFALDADYGYGTTPINFSLLITGSATPATVPDSNYTSKKSTLLKYDGSKSTSQFLNKFTEGDTGTYGKLPTAEVLKTSMAYCSWIGGWPPEKMNASAVSIKYFINADGSISTPNIAENTLELNQGIFRTGERVQLHPISNGELVGSTTQYNTVLRGATTIIPIMVNQISHGENMEFSPTMSIYKPNSNTYSYFAIFDSSLSTNPSDFFFITGSNPNQIITKNNSFGEFQQINDPNDYDYTFCVPEPNSGYNEFTLPFNIKVGDEIRFNGLSSYRINNIEYDTPFSDDITFTLNGNLPSNPMLPLFPDNSNKINRFSIIRYVDASDQVLIEGFRPPNAPGVPFIVRPEFVVPELNKNIDEIIIDLTQKGLIT
jgi:hypothetical protein